MSKIMFLELPNDTRLALKSIESYKPYRRNDVLIRTTSGDTVDISCDEPEDQKQLINYLDSLEIIHVDPYPIRAKEEK